MDPGMLQMTSSLVEGCLTAAMKDCYQVVQWYQSDKHLHRIFHHARQ